MAYLAYLTTRPSEEIVEFFKTREGVASADCLIVASAELKLELLRQLISSLQLSPLGQKRLAVIEQAELLTEAMQNTLLKTIEEPPARLILVLQASAPEKLLPTVRSRLHFLEERPKHAQPADLADSADFDLAERLAKAENRDEVAQLVNQAIELRYQQLFERPSKQLTEELELLQRAQTKLKLRANYKLVIDWLLLRLAGS